MLFRSCADQRSVVDYTKGSQTESSFACLDAEPDPSFVLERNNETHQTLLGGQGEMQLNIIKSKLKDKFGVDVEAVPRKIAYRETIKGTSDVQGKYKKQSEHFFRKIFKGTGMLSR